MCQIQSCINNSNFHAFSCISCFFPGRRCSNDLVGFICIRDRIHGRKNNVLDSAEFFQPLDIFIRRGNSDTANADGIVVVHFNLVKSACYLVCQFVLFPVQTVFNNTCPEALRNFRSFIASFQQRLCIQKNNGINNFLSIDFLFSRRDQIIWFLSQSFNPKVICIFDLAESNLSRSRGECLFIAVCIIVKQFFSAACRRRFICCPCIS